MKHEVIKLAIKEDIGREDITSNSLIDKNYKVRAVIICKQKCVLCGVSVAGQVFSQVDKTIICKFLCKDGKTILPRSRIALIEGNARSILAAERTALNFLSHLSGIATKTHAFVKKIRPYKARIFDTRKTTPGLRSLQKYAVRCGGGLNHRMTLHDMILIKDNHKKSLFPDKNIGDLIKKAKNKYGKTKKIEAEVETLHELNLALQAKPDIIMLDNMSLATIKKAIRLIKKTSLNSTPRIEVSGNIVHNNVRAIAQTGVDMISIGSLTNSFSSIDFGLEVL
ncbi:carboxylating nicotinate-nucleotide diphosphorylase [Candidatus Omnitrophota bacterium]